MTNKKSGKKILLASCFLLFTSLLITSCSNPVLQKQEKEQTQKLINQVQNSKLIILDIYHNRCESCKFIEPVIEELQANYSKNPNISFLRYDLSNSFTIFKSRKIAKEIGIENIYKTQRYSGVVLLIDTKDKQVLDTLIAEYNIERYNQIIEKRLNETQHTL